MPNITSSFDHTRMLDSTAPKLLDQGNPWCEDERSGLHSTIILFRDASVLSFLPFLLDFMPTH